MAVICLGRCYDEGLLVDGDGLGGAVGWCTGRGGEGAIRSRDRISLGDGDPERIC